MTSGVHRMVQLVVWSAMGLVVDGWGQGPEQVHCLLGAPLRSVDQGPPQMPVKVGVQWLQSTHQISYYGRRLGTAVLVHPWITWPPLGLLMGTLQVCISITVPIPVTLYSLNIWVYTHLKHTWCPNTIGPLLFSQTPSAKPLICFFVTFHAFTTFYPKKYKKAQCLSFFCFFHAFYPTKAVKAWKVEKKAN